MKYKVGDKVKIKSLDWFNTTRCGGPVICDGFVFLEFMSEYCGKELTIDYIYTDSKGKQAYIMKETNTAWRFTDSMIECIVDAEPQEKMVSLEKVEEWLYKNFYESYNLNDCGKYDLDEPYITSSFDTINEMFDDLCKTMEE